MGLLDWDHNAYYHRLLLRQLPTPCTRVLDVGCGAGAFAAELARRVEHVDVIDRSPAMIEAARQTTPANVSCILGDVMRDPLPAGTYDAIVSVTALHHMPVDDALRRLFRALAWRRPGRRCPAPARSSAGTACRAPRGSRSPGARRHVRRPQSARSWRLVPARAQPRGDAKGP